METRILGKNGPKVSVVGLGCNNFGGRLDLEATRKVVHKALDLGVTLFDTADVYGSYGYGNYGGSEDQLGQILGPRRKDIVLASKFGMAMNDAGTLKGAAPAYIRVAIEASLKRLRTDCIDLYQIHRPDPQTPIEETMRALDELVKQGKVRHIGCSGFSTAQINAAQAAAQAPQPDAADDLAGRIQPAGAPGRSRSHARDQAAWTWPSALLPARERHAHRQVQAQRAGAARARAWPRPAA